MKLAIISRRDSPNTLDLIKAAEDRGVECTVFPLKELAFDIENLFDHDFFSHDAYLFRGYNNNYALAQALAQALISEGKTVIDAALASHFIPSKMHEALIYKQKNIPHMRTFHAGSTKAWQILQSRPQPPLVIKDIDSQRGKGVRLCHDEGHVLREVEEKGTKIIIQEFVKMAYDIRVICIGDKVIGAIKRSSSGEDFRTNVSQGGRAEAYTLNEEEQSLALQAHRSMGYDISGVDMARDSEGTLQVIETNVTPEWQGFKQATGINVADHIMQYIQERL